MALLICKEMISYVFVEDTSLPVPIPVIEAEHRHRTLGLTEIQQYARRGNLFGGLECFVFGCLWSMILACHGQSYSMAHPAPLLFCTLSSAFEGGACAGGPSVKSG